MTTPDEPAPLETVGERYVLVELVDATDVREVWRGHDDLAGRRVAVTRYLAPTEEWRHSFDVRARALEALNDPGIATVLRHDASDAPPWLATAWVDGETVAAINDETGFTVDDALAVVGQTAFALAAAHGAGVGHGSIDAGHILVRPDGSIALTGFAVDHNPPVADDLRALTTLCHELINSDDAAVAKFFDWLTGDAPSRATDPTEIGRTALALASAQRAGTSGASLTPGADAREEAPEPQRPWYTEEEKRRVRNRLIALGAIVVLGGAALLRIFGSGAAQVTVPDVRGLQYPVAQHELIEVGLRTSETTTSGSLDSVGTVKFQDPAPGTRTKVGALVDLTVVTGTAQ